MGRGTCCNRFTCCIWGAILLALLLALAFWPMLRDRIDREVQRLEKIGAPGG